MTSSTWCSRCQEPITFIGDMLGLHTVETCDLTYFRKFGATKCDMVSILELIKVWPTDYVYIKDNLCQAYPRVASKFFETIDDQGRDTYDIFVERWAGEAIKLFVNSDKHVNLSLAEYIDLMASKRHEKLPKS